MACPRLWRLRLRECEASFLKNSSRSISSLTTIQGGRAIAALAVVAYHLSNIIGQPGYMGLSVLTGWTKYGHFGVDFFFVLSGFVILMAHWDDLGNPVELGRYLWRRFVRVYPIYWIYTCATLIFFAVVSLQQGRKIVMPTTAGWASTVTLLRFSPESPPIQPAWTLFHEVAFYLLFSLLIVNRTLGISVMALWIGLCVARWQYPTGDGMTAQAVYLSAYSVHFALGMLIYIAYRYLNWSAGLILGAIGLMVVVVTCCYRESVTQLAMAAGFSCLLLAVTNLERMTGICVPRWLRQTGDASYSIYLLHGALIPILLKAMIYLGVSHTVGGLGIFALVFTATTLLAYLAYRFVEEPMLSALRFRFGFKTRA